MANGGAGLRRRGAGARVPSLLSLLLLIVAVGPCCVAASSGDRDPVYRGCVDRCVQRAPPAADTTLDWPLRLLQWSWLDNCRYECMHETVALRLDQGKPIEQYHGKWPFIRLWGIQEPASTLFSLLNLAPYLIGLPHYWAAVPKRDFFTQMWVVYSFAGMNAWLWSTAFHMRDMLFTERMDYFSATLLSFLGCYCAFIRVFEGDGGFDSEAREGRSQMISPRQIRRRDIRVGAALLLVAAYAAHVSYLSLVTFDYGWNMAVNVVVGAVTATLWLGWAATLRLPHSHLAVVTVLLLSTAMSLELLDFAPLWWTLDAHSLWHAATVPSLPIWYRFLIKDAQYRNTKAE